MTRISELEVLDIRFPTSRALDGSDAMNPDPDYSAAYVVVRDEAGDGLEGHGLTFTIGRGTEVVVAAVEALRPLVVGRSSDELFADMGAFWRSLVGDSQLRWIGPEKGVIHLATAAVVNAVWDLFAKRAGKPLWQLLADMTPAEQRRAGRLPLHHRRCSRPTRRSPVSSDWHRRVVSAWRSCGATAIPPTPRPSAGSATLTTRSVACAARRSPRAGPASR